MSLFLDAAVILIIAVVVWQSYRRGFLHTIITFAGYILALLAAISLSSPAGTWIYQHLLQGALTSWVWQAISTQSTSGAASSLGPLTSMLGSNVNLDALLKQGTTLAQDTLIHSVVEPIGTTIGRGIAFIVLFFLFCAAVRILAGFSLAVSHIPVIGLINRLGGAVLGFFKALLILFVLCTLLAALLPALSYAGAPLTQSSIDQSHLFRFFYEANPMQSLLLNGK